MDGPPSAIFCSSVTYEVSKQQLQDSHHKAVASRLNWGKSTSYSMLILHLLVDRLPYQFAGLCAFTSCH